MLLRSFRDVLSYDSIIARRLFIISIKPLFLFDRILSLFFIIQLISYFSLNALKLLNPFLTPFNYLPNPFFAFIGYNNVPNVSFYLPFFLFIFYNVNNSISLLKYNLPHLSCCVTTLHLLRVVENVMSPGNVNRGRNQIKKIYDHRRGLRSLQTWYV